MGGGDKKGGGGRRAGGWGRKAGPGRRERHLEREEPANGEDRFKNGMADPERIPGVQTLTLPVGHSHKSLTPPSLGWLICKMRRVQSRHLLVLSCFIVL